MPSSGNTPSGPTAALVTQAMAVRFESMPADVQQVTRDCLLDWIAVTLAGASDPILKVLREVAEDEGGRPVASLIGVHGKMTALQAALINGTASHVLDFDDVNMHLPGHPSVALFPALLALAESRIASGSDLLAAFAAGYEAMCHVARLTGAGHYAGGFHATGTIGTIGAAVACAHLLRLNEAQACHALGLAATFAAGLQGMFGTMAKPLHAGRAAQSGLYAALLANHGFESRVDALEGPRGFLDVYGDGSTTALAPAPDDWYLRSAIFKFHASCFGTHAPIECVHRLTANGDLRIQSVAEITVKVSDVCAAICNIARPQTGLEMKFSLPGTIAMALRAIDTGVVSSFSTEQATHVDTRTIADRVRVERVPGWPITRCELAIFLSDGTVRTAAYDCGEPMTDKGLQSDRLRAKAKALIGQELNIDCNETLLAFIDGIASIPDVRGLLDLTRPR